MNAKNYTPFFDEIKNKIRAAQYAAMREVNIQLIQLYWEIGRSISEKQKLGWGKSVVESLSIYLKQEFPQTKGFSSTNLWLMTQFYQSYCDEVNLQPLVGEISWSKHAVILAKIKDRELRRFYITSTRNLNWTKAQLIREIENETHRKILNSQNSFLDQSREKLITLKDKYLFDFLELDMNHSERDLEKGLLNNVQKFLLEMGNQFSFIGSQFKIQLEGKEYFIDLLLFHRTLQCLVAIELKVGEFIPEYKGKMEFYLALLNDKVRLPHENDSVGIIICKSKNKTVVEYSLKKSNYPIGVSSYSTSKVLPEEFSAQLPTLEAIKKSFGK
ncbi:MAG: YhcG family protein [Bacteroidota bacterium]|jgi:predicted nuclease of restriction endonuclease-like (RecB) superfamily